MRKKWTNLVKNSREISLKVILASQSPRRKTILKELNIPFEECHSGINEIVIRSATAQENVIDLATKKVRACIQQNALVIGMDSLVVLGKEKMGKPQSVNEARRMLQRLSGKKHFVITGIALSYKDRFIVGSESTDVYFRKLLPEEVEWYLSTGEPIDKAGAYAIQGFGRIFIRKIEGCYFNVLGFPINRFQRMLARLGFTLSDLIQDNKA